MSIRLDFETFSEVDLRVTGQSYYAMDKSTEVLCLGYKINDGEVKLWEPSQDYPEDLFEAVERTQYEVYAWNASFERRIWHYVCHKRMGWPDIDFLRYRCTMALAASLSLPLALEKAGSALGLNIVKDQRGKHLLNKLSKPRRPSKNNPDTRWTLDTAEQDYLDLYEYCKQDVRAEEAVHEAMPIKNLPKQEQEYWFMDQRINDRGVHVDTHSIDKILQYEEQNRKRLSLKLAELTDYEITSGDQRDKLLRWCLENGADTACLPNLQRPSIAHALNAEHVPERVKNVLNLRLELGKKTAAKYRKMLMGLCEGDRILDCFQYHAGHTGRAGGRRVQLQNLARPLIKYPEEAIEDILVNTPIDFIETMHGAKFTDIVVSCIRGIICAAPGNKLVVADYSAIEARVAAWIAGQDDVVAVFRGHGKIYEKAASGIYNVAIEEVTKDQRFVGKVAVLALGFGGGFNTFIGMAKNYGVDIDENFAKDIVKKWRKANRHIVNFWYRTEDAAITAIESPGMTIKVKCPIPVYFKFTKHYLWCKLPSGRLLSYPFAKLEKGYTPWGDIRFQVTYKRQGENSLWINENTYGGRLVENIVQATARDLLMNGMYECEKAGIPIIAHIHDEAITELPEDKVDLPLFEKKLCTLPDWAAGLPLDAEGYVADRYRKD